MVRLHDVAPDGTATVFDEQVSTIKQGNTAFDFKAVDWTLPAGAPPGLLSPARQDETGHW